MAINYLEKKKVIKWFNIRLRWTTTVKRIDRCDREINKNVFYAPCPLDFSAQPPPPQKMR